MVMAISGWLFLWNFPGDLCDSMYRSVLAAGRVDCGGVGIGDIPK
jgi:hypothetical protein